MERRLAAILAADVVGYSHLMAEDEGGTYEALRSALSEVVAPTVQRHGGDVFKTTGDGFLAAFGSVNQALEAAIAIQEAFATRPLRLRMGINLGDVIAADGDVFGDGVNVAARLESMAEPGGHGRERAGRAQRRQEARHPLRAARAQAGQEHDRADRGLRDALGRDRRAARLGTVAPASEGGGRGRGGRRRGERRLDLPRRPGPRRLRREPAGHERSAARSGGRGTPLRLRFCRSTT